MSNFKNDILIEAGNEKIIGVVIGGMGWGEYNSNIVPLYDKQPKGKLLSWEEAEEFLDYMYDPSYGAPECNAVYAWTETKILFVVQYDGSTTVNSVPRNPIDVMPEMFGG